MDDINENDKNNTNKTMIKKINQKFPIPKKEILEIKKYVPGKSVASGSSRSIKLSSNETPLGTSSKAKEIIKQVSDYKLPIYPDGDSYSLREAIAKHNNIEINRVVCGNGSDELIMILTKIFAGIGDEILYSQYGFLMYPIAAKVVGATPISAPEFNLKTNIKNLISHVTKNTKVCFIANPNNPTGTYLSKSELIDLRNRLPKECLLVIDSAYSEYVSNEDYDNGISIARGRKDIVVTRTFSKIYGLASLRLGWAYCPEEIVDFVNSVRAPFNVNSLAQLAGKAALEDNVFINHAKLHNDKWKPWLENELRNLGIKIQPGVANFCLLEFNKKGHHTAINCFKYLLDNGIIVRGVSEYGLPSHLRVTVGTEEDNHEFIRCMKSFFNQ